MTWKELAEKILTLNESQQAQTVSVITFNCDGQWYESDTMVVFESTGVEPMRWDPRHGDPSESVYRSQAKRLPANQLYLIHSEKMVTVLQHPEHWGK